MSENSFLIYGPKEDCGVPKISMGKYFYECLKKRDYNEILNIDAVTKEVLSCGQLLEKSIKFTQILERFSIKNGDVISIIAENDLNYFVPILAALYMGVVINTLHPAYTTGELRHALSIAKPKLVICSESALKNVLAVKKLECPKTVILLKPAKYETTVDCMDTLLNSVKININNYRPQDFDYTQQDAFILMSSGTTGLPKGVLLTHENIRAAMIYILHPHCGEASADHRTILFVPYSHVYGILLEASAIVSSMKIVIMEKFEPELFLKCIEGYKITKLFLVPPIVNFLVHSPLLNNYNTSSIKDLVCAGAPLGEGLIEQTLERLGTLKIRQAYGLTEVCGASTYQSPNNMKIGSVGNLVPNMIGKVCSMDSKTPLGLLQVGEICLKGPLVMKGYVGNTTQTQNCIDSDGFLHSGDIGYYDKDGQFYVIDRLKELIKYKGFQVSPAELEALLLTHPKIEDCGVIGIPDEKSGELPLAFVVPKNSIDLSEKEVVDFVAARISTQKQLHGGVQFINEIPKTASGKILRRRLLEIFKSQPTFKPNAVKSKI